MSNVKIVSDGTAQGTKVFVGDNYIKGLTKVEIEPIKPGEPVRAKLTVDMLTLRAELKDCEIECTDILAGEKIRQALLSDDS
jgi:hypothetical protein